MPHFIAEYSANLEGVADFAGLFEKVHQVLGDSGVFPLGGIRSRAIRMDIYRMADAKHDYGFIHMTLKVGAGRDLATRKKVADQLFETIKEHFADLQAKRLLALSFEMEELNADLNYKQNNIHAFLANQ
ncbi:5-carboxymethyl-2-hydroxymuconate Delta-isomerase [Entomomonas asaccharolytica]|uniref:5-carboxymethyl-2-hydroxymuconate Delta-isomerase n=1 Tax=Entomomonas asaccharolytica TaxID=2785331 RepID=A0A974NES5_9GAMM|nr:5-carboxymethyl-2-hydroxymuconate Delta-isomerase [Entomomonas asaccharolytica]QQP85179.1 5-carboxymethyl-2-hydroxymuconate Delta-isomerase [Entomomonas asaccharolytica]